VVATKYNQSHGIFSTMYLHIIFKLTFAQWIFPDENYNRLDPIQTKMGWSNKFNYSSG
jgi:hypothetical protein